jgi:hypothetical protein
LSANFIDPSTKGEYNFWDKKTMFSATFKQILSKEKKR